MTDVSSAWLQAVHMNEAVNDAKSLYERVHFIITRGLFNDLASFMPTLRAMIRATTASAAFGGSRNKVPGQGSGTKLPEGENRYRYDIDTPICMLYCHLPTENFHL